MAQAGVMVKDGRGSGAALIVDPTSKSARVTLYNSAGKLLRLGPKVIGSYSVAIRVPESNPVAGTVVAGTYCTWRMFSFQPHVWAKIRRIKVNDWYGSNQSGGAQAGYTSQAYLYRFRGVIAAASAAGKTPMGASAAQPIVDIPRKTRACPPSVMEVQSLNTVDGTASLDETGLIVEPQFCQIGVPTSSNTKPFFPAKLDMPFCEGSEFWLAPGEGLGLRLVIFSTALVVANNQDDFNGAVEWDEVTWENSGLPALAQAVP